MKVIKTAFTIIIIFFIGGGIIARQEEEEEAEAEVDDYDTKIDENDDSIIPFTHLCKFDQPLLNHSTTSDEDFCKCDVISSSLGHPSVKIDCEHSDHVTNLTNKIFQAQKLPLNTLTLILSYQHFREVPEFIGDQLEQLVMSNNFIKIIKNANFIRVTSLKHLDLSYNSIAEIEPQAFEQLQFLRHLDLTNNELIVMPTNVFHPLISLETLSLSNNEGIGRLMTTASIYLHLSVTPKLQNLFMERCNLSTINLRQGDGLLSVNLAFNNISDFSTIALPDALQSLDLSGNPIWEFTAKSLPHLASLKELMLRDLPYLTVVDEYSLYGFPQLHHLTFEGSKNISQIHPHAFGLNVIEESFDVELKKLNLRGCNLRTLDSSLQVIFNQLDELHLEGNPFNCNCEVKWIKHLSVETHLRCHKPEVFHGKLLSEIPEKKMKCENLFVRKFINTIVLLFLLIACSLTIWFFLSRLNPSRKNKLQKVGPESPYQRVTIEPNRAEYSLY